MFLVRIKCVKDYHCFYTKNKSYCFVTDREVYIGFDDEPDDVNQLYLSEIEEYFDIDNQKIVEISKTIV